LLHFIFRWLFFAVYKAAGCGFSSGYCAFMVSTEKQKAAINTATEWILFMVCFLVIKEKHLNWNKWTEYLRSGQFDI